MFRCAYIFERKERKRMIQSTIQIEMVLLRPWTHSRLPPSLQRLAVWRQNHRSVAKYKLWKGDVLLPVIRYRVLLGWCHDIYLGLKIDVSRLNIDWTLTVDTMLRKLHWTCSRYKHIVISENLNKPSHYGTEIRKGARKRRTRRLSPEGEVVLTKNRMAYHR